jgi:pSer/pThr/pTyr-binding forkhead associated (FHA) protein
MNSKITLTVTNGTLAGKEYSFDAIDRCVVGRAPDCGIQFPQDAAHMSVSRHHCLLIVAPPTIWVRDLGSRNGTFVNGIKIGQRSDSPDDDNGSADSPDWQLKDGDEIRVGNTVFHLSIVTAGEPQFAVPIPMVMD